MTTVNLILVPGGSYSRREVTAGMTWRQFANSYDLTDRQLFADSISVAGDSMDSIIAPGVRDVHAVKSVKGN